MGPVEFIGAAAKGAAKFASKHTTLTVLGGAAALGGGIVAYNNSGEADRTANGGAFMKQDVAKSDKNGDLSIRMQGLKDAPKANEPAKSDAKTGNGDVLKKLQGAAKDADIKAEAEKATEQTSAQAELPPEKPYIPETDAKGASYNDTNANLLDGNGSNAFKTAHFTSSGGGSESNAGRQAAQSGKKGATKAASGTGTSVTSSATTAAGSGVKSAATTSEAASSGEVKTTKSDGDKGGETGNNQGGDGSTTQTGKETSSGNKSTSDGKTETASTSNGETGPETGNVVTPTTTNVDDTVSMVAAPQREEVRSSERPEWELQKEKVLARQKEIEALEAQKQEEERKAPERLREKYLNALRNAFEKEADVDVDAVVSPSDRERAGIASMYVMELAAEADKRVKRVTLYMDGKGTIRDLIGFLKFLGAKNERGELNPNVSFLLPNGTGFLSGDENIEGVKLETQSVAVKITFPKGKPTASDTKKPDAGKTGETTAWETKGATTVETPDWMKIIGDNAEEEEQEKRLKRIGAEFRPHIPSRNRFDSFDGNTNFRMQPLLPLYTAPSQGATPQGTPLNSPRNSTPPSLHSSRKSSFDGPLPDLFDDLGETKEGETDTNGRIDEIRKKNAASKIQGAWRKYKFLKSIEEIEEEQRKELEKQQKERMAREEQQRMEEQQERDKRRKEKKHQRNKKTPEKTKEEKEKRLKEQRDEEDRTRKAQACILRKEEAKKGSRGEYHPELYSRIHSELNVSYGSLDCAEEIRDERGTLCKGNNEKWYEKLPFKDFALFVTETGCKKVDFSGLTGTSYAGNYLRDPDGLKVLSGMTLTVKKHTGDQKDNPYKKAFGDGFWQDYTSGSEKGFMKITTAAQPSGIRFVHEKLSGYNWHTYKDWSKDGYRLVWNRYAKRLAQLCDTPISMDLFADKVAAAAEAISGTGAKRVDFTVFCPFDGELRSKLTEALLERGIDVLDYENKMSEELLARGSEGYSYGVNGDYVRYLQGNELSKDELQKVQKTFEASKKALLSPIMQGKGEYTVKEETLYACSVEEIIKAADANENLTKLILPWKKCEGLYPLEGNLTAALGAIANTESQHEWTIVLDGVVHNKARELQESISQAIKQVATRRCCYNPFGGTIAVVKKENFPTAWSKAMEACIAIDAFVDVYEHDLEVPGFDFVAPAMGAKSILDIRGYLFKFEIPAKSNEFKQVVKVIADYVMSKRKVHEEARTVQFTVRGAGITPEAIEKEMETAIGRDNYRNYFHTFLSFEKIVSKKDEKGKPIEFEPDTARIVLTARRFTLGKLSQCQDTIAIDAFDAKDEAFRSEGLHAMEHAKDRKFSRLVLPKGKELTDEEWQEFTNSLWFYFFNGGFKDLVFESDKEGVEKLKACAENNRKKDPYPHRGANRWTVESTGEENELRIVSWSEIYERHKDKFLQEIGKSNETTKVENFTWLDKEKLAEIVLQMSKPESKGHLEVTFDTKGALKSAVEKLLQDTSVADKRDSWILHTPEKIDLASLLPYMKTYFALPLKENEILFYKDEKKCRERASALAKGTFKETTKKTIDIDAWYQRFCMKEALEAAGAADSKVETLKVNIDENNADALQKTLLDFCQTVPVQRKPFTLRLVAPKITGDEILKKLVESSGRDWCQLPANKSIILAGRTEKLNDKGEEVRVLGHCAVSLTFMRLEDFFITRYINRPNCSSSGIEIGESYKDLPTETLFNCMSDPKCEAVHFEILRDMTKEEVIKGITSMLANQKDGHTGFTVHFASEKIAKPETVKEIADAVSKLNKNGNNRFVVPMYKDNLFLFVDKDGWAIKEQMAKKDSVEYKEDLKGNRLQELLFLMSLPTSKAKTLALKDFSLYESSLKLILDHGNRTGWSLTGCHMRVSVKGKSMCCLSITDKPYAQHFLDEKTFKKEILSVFRKEEAKSLAKNTCDLQNIFDYKASCWEDICGRGFISLAEQLNGGYRTLKLKHDFNYMNQYEAKKAAEFIEWIKEGLKAICNVENPGKRFWCLSLKNLSKEQRKQITRLKLDKNAKRELAFSDGDEGELNIGTRKPFAQRLTKDGVLVLEDFDLCVSNFDEIFQSANGLPGLKEVACPEDGDVSDVARSVKKVLKSGLNKTWERITFPSGWDIKKIAEKINNGI